MPLLEFRNVSVDLGSNPVLHDVSLAVEQGDHIALVGENGAGKTTLLRAALGLVTARTGEVNVGGHNLRGRGRRDLARAIAYVPQELNVPFAMTVKEFVALGRFARLGFLEALKNRDEQKVEVALARAGASELKDRLLSSLSGGERQRVLIAGALAQEAPLLLLDEVSHFLDPRHALEVRMLLSSLNKDGGVSILSVTHDINQAALQAGRVIALKAGSKVFDGKPREFMSGEVLQTVFGRPFSFIRHPHSGTQIVLPDA